MSTLSERKEISPRNWPRWNGTAPLPDKQYNEWWLARVKARCVVDSNQGGSRCRPRPHRERRAVERTPRC